ncbi:MAG: hypothetical protein RSD57_18435 [Comamonas sp.]
MNNNQISKKLVYRRCKISPDPGQTLQQLLSAALLQFPTPASRYEPLDAGSNELRTIGKDSLDAGCIVGFLTTFVRGARQPVVSDDPSAKHLSVDAVTPPQAVKGSPQKQFAPGILYFAVMDNHIALSQTQSMRAGAFEAHLNWLLKSRTSVLPSTSVFALTDEAQKATKQRIRDSHIKAISLGQPLMQLQPAAAMKPQGRKKKAPPLFKPAGAALDFIKSMFPNNKDFESLGLDDVFDSNLEVWVEIRYPKRKRTQGENSIDLMDTLGLALRDIEGDQVSLELANGFTVTGQELKISGEISVTSLTNGLPNEVGLYSGMTNWLMHQIKDGVVDP